MSASTPSRAALFGSIVLAALPQAAAAQAPALARAPAFRAAQLTELPRAGWLTNGGNLANQGYSPLTAINRDNVANLRGVWRASLGLGDGKVFVGQLERRQAIRRRLRRRHESRS